MIKRVRSIQKNANVSGRTTIPADKVQEHFYPQVQEKPDETLYL
jgi:hypothetical protein